MNDRKSTGHCSTGDCSTGHWSTGHWSTGECSTGNRSTGNRSTGDWSTGDCSTGHCSTGHWSTSNYSTGHFSTVDYAGFGAFDKPCALDAWEDAQKPMFLYFELTKWIPESDMTAQEKEDFGSYKTTGGYLKVYDYKEAWKMAWDNASDEDKELLYKLPNFDADVFKKISGIDVTKDSELEQKKRALIAKANELLKQAEEL